MIKEVYDFVTPFGRLGEFIDATPKDRISKVFLEEKLFETWYHGRTVLIGDGKLSMQCSFVLKAVRQQRALNAKTRIIYVCTSCFWRGSSSSCTQGMLPLSFV